MHVTMLPRSDMHLTGTTAMQDKAHAWLSRDGFVSLHNACVAGPTWVRAMRDLTARRIATFDYTRRGYVLRGY